MLARMDSHAFDYREPTGVYWMPVTQAKTDEVHPRLLQAIAERPGMKLYTTSLFAISGGEPVGYIEIAIDHETSEACGLYHLPMGFEEYVTKAVWFPAKEDIEENFTFLADSLEERGII